MRKEEIDILKGMMIISVVIGHCSFSHDLIIDVYWFHMPAFFFISGYLTKYSSTNPFKDFLWLKKKVVKYVIPYFTYCIIFYAIFHPENILKNALRVIYAGYNNITIYSYPFWFINGLFSSSSVFRIIQWKIPNKSMMSILCFIVYVFIHIKCLYPFSYPLPWSIDQSLGIIIFMHAGYLFREYDQNIIVRSCGIIFVVLFCLATIMTGVHFEINMQKMIYNNFLFDAIIPISFIIFFYEISKLLKNSVLFKTIFKEIGNASITIFFTHAAILYLLSDKYPWLNVLGGLLGGYFLHKIFMLNKYTQLLFLGQYENNIYQ